MPVIQRQIAQYGYRKNIRPLLVKGQTRYLSAKDRREMIVLLDAEYPN